MRDYLDADADASDEAWVVLRGTLAFDSAKLPGGRETPQTQGDSRELTARFSGLGLGPDGFTRRMDRPVTLSVLCFGPWCGGVTPGAEYLIFARQSGGQMTVFADPCGSRLHLYPTEALLARVTRCFQGGPCAPADPMR